MKQLPKNVKTSANETAVLECDVDAPGIVSYWLKDGERLDDVRHAYKYQMTSDKMTHKLFVKDASLTDSGLYTFVAGNARSHTTLYVEGERIKTIDFSFLTFFRERFLAFNHLGTQLVPPSLAVC